MQPLIMIMLIGVAAAAMGTGFLTNTFTLNVQQLAVEETDITSPVTTVNVDFVLSKAIVGTHTDLGSIDGAANDTHFHNLIQVCKVHTDSNLEAGSTIICKLSDDDDDIIAEGKTVLAADYSASGAAILVTIGQTAFHFSNDVQEVHDVKIVILGNSTNGT